MYFLKICKENDCPAFLLIWEHFECIASIHTKHFSYFFTGDILKCVPNTSPQESFPCDFYGKCLGRTSDVMPYAY